MPQASSWSGVTYPRQRSNDYEYTCLTLERGKTYNIPDAEVAQVVEQRTENPRVSGSTPLLGTSYEAAKHNRISSATPCHRGNWDFEVKLAEVAER